MYGCREFEIALITLIVAVAACCIADYGVGIMFGVLTGGAVCFAVACIYELSDLSSTKRSRAGQSGRAAVRGLMPGREHDRDRFVRAKTATWTADDQQLPPYASPLVQHGSDPAPRPAAAPATPRGFLLGALGRGTEDASH